MGVFRRTSSQLHLSSLGKKMVVNVLLMATLSLEDPSVPSTQTVTARITRRVASAEEAFVGRLSGSVMKQLIVRSWTNVNQEIVLVQVTSVRVTVLLTQIARISIVTVPLVTHASVKTVFVPTKRKLLNANL